MSGNLHADVPATAVPSGWYPDPADPRLHRWWTGTSWSVYVQEALVEPESEPEVESAQDAILAPSGRHTAHEMKFSIRSFAGRFPRHRADNGATA
jgi:hypothetical protein